MAIKYRELVECYQAVCEDAGRGPTPEDRTRAADRMVREAFAGPERPHDFQIGRLFEQCFGWHALRTARESPDVSIRRLMEAAGATSVNNFTNITGQVIFSAILPKYEAEEFVFTKLIPVVNTALSGEKIPGVTRIGDAAQVVEENGEFPLVGVSETYIHTPPTKKRGYRTAVTKEAIFFDRTGDLLDRFGLAAYDYGLNKEKRAIDCAIDENAGAVSAMSGGHRYHWRDASIATYGDNTGTHTFDNLQASNALVDWSNVQSAWLLLKAMKDPDINEPMNFQPRHLVCTPQLLPTAFRVKRAMETRTHVGGYAATGNLGEFTAPNPVPNFFDFDPVSSQLLADRLGTDTSWFLGDLARLARYMQNWPLQVVQAPSLSEDEFKRDIVTQYRVSERGAFATWEPRAVVKSTA